MGCTNVMRSASQALNRVRFANLTVTGTGPSTGPSTDTNTNNRDELLNTGGFTQQERVFSQNV